MVMEDMNYMIRKNILEPLSKRLASHKGMISLRELQAETEEELSALPPSLPGRTFKEELRVRKKGFCHDKRTGNHAISS
jgi:hypothetical protein